jgi:hypothetical protein
MLLVLSRIFALIHRDCLAPRRASSDNLSSHQEGVRPCQPASPGKVARESGCGHCNGNQTGISMNFFASRAAAFPMSGTS